MRVYFEKFHMECRGLRARTRMPDMRVIGKIEVVNDATEADLILPWANMPALESAEFSFSRDHNPLDAFKALRIALETGCPVPDSVADYFIEADRKLRAVPKTINGASYPRTVSDALGFGGNAFRKQAKRLKDYELGLVMHYIVAVGNGRGNIERAKRTIEDEYGVSYETAKNAWEGWVRSHPEIEEDAGPKEPTKLLGKIVSARKTQ